MRAKLAGMLRTSPMDTPTIARRRAALGGGMDSTSACDICVQREGRVATTEVSSASSLGHQPYVIRAIGERQSYRYFQSAERIPAPHLLARSPLHEGSRGVFTNWMRGAEIVSTAGWRPRPRLRPMTLIRAVANKPVSPTRWWRTPAAHRRPACHAGSREGLGLPRKRRRDGRQPERSMGTITHPPAGRDAACRRTSGRP